ncbi:MAG: ABC transporter ATP-binding protein, partial [Firmicutes bacterium]|nr:ABC transporter ATP-binding protein [Candidatus Colimorpha enterica]
MPRNLEQLQKQYNSQATGPSRRPMMGGGRRGNPAAKGKPKDTKKSIKRILSYMHGYGPRFAAVLVCMLLSTVTNLLGSFLIAPIIDKLTVTVVPDTEITMSLPEKIADRIITVISTYFGDSSVSRYILAALLLLGAVYLVGIATSYLQARLMVVMSQSIIERIRNDLFTKLQELPVRYFDSHPTGEIMSRFTNDIDSIDTMINNSLTSIISGAVTIAGTLVFMFTTSWVLSIVTIVFVPIFLWGGMKIANLSRKHYSAQQAALGAVNGYMEETVTGQKVIKTFNHEDEAIYEFSQLNNDMRDKQLKAMFWGGVMGPIMGNTSQISYAVTVGVGGVLMVMSKLTPGALTVFANFSRHFSMPINSISQQMATIFSALAGAERVFEVMDSKPELPDAPDASDMEGMKGYVVLDNVTFGYNPDKIVLKNISLYAKPGQKIAFVGSTGAGKTTITNLINRFYDIEQGTITIDGVNIKDIKRDELRE